MKAVGKMVGPLSKPLLFQKVGFSKQLSVSQIQHLVVDSPGAELHTTCHKKKPENLRNILTSAMEKGTFSASESSDLIAELFIYRG